MLAVLKEEDEFNQQYKDWVKQYEDWKEQNKSKYCGSQTENEHFP